MLSIELWIVWTLWALAAGVTIFFIASNHNENAEKMDTLKPYHWTVPWTMTFIAASATWVFLLAIQTIADWIRG